MFDAVNIGVNSAESAEINNCLCDAFISDDLLLSWFMINYQSNYLVLPISAMVFTTVRQIKIYIPLSIVY